MEGVKSEKTKLKMKRISVAETGRHDEARRACGLLLARMRGDGDSEGGPDRPGLPRAERGGDGFGGGAGGDISPWGGEAGSLEYVRLSLLLGFLSLPYGSRQTLCACLRACQR